MGNRRAFDGNIVGQLAARLRIVEKQLAKLSRPCAGQPEGERQCEGGGLQAGPEAFQWNIHAPTFVPVQKKVEGPFVQYIDEMQSVPVTNQWGRPRAQTVQEMAEVPRMQHTDEVKDMPVTEKRQVPVVRTLQRTSKDPFVQHTDEMQDVPVTEQRSKPIVKPVQGTDGACKSQYTEGVQDVPVTEKRRVPVAQTCLETGEAPRVQYTGEMQDVPVTKLRQGPMAQAVQTPENDDEEEEDEYVEHSEFTEPCCGDRKGVDYAGGKLCMENGVEEEMSEEEADEDEFARYVVLPAAFLAWQDLAASWRRKKKRKKKGKKKKEEKMIDQTKDQPAKLKEETALRETFAETDKTDAVPNLGRNDRGAEYLWKRLQKLETEQGRAQRDVMVRSLSEHTQARLKRYVDGNSWQSAAAASTEPTPTDDRPFWMRMPEDVTQKEYAVFYKAWTDSQENFFSVRHFSGEGPGFRALLFVPRKAPADLVAGVRQGNNIRLYVRSAFLMADCNGLLPEWLNFVEGVVDLEALPSDLSCEVLQQNKILGFIGQRLVEKCLEMFAEIAEVEDDYMDFYGQFGDCLRLGVREKSSRAKVAELLRYPSSKSGGKLIGFRDYGDWEMEGQDVITYTTKASIAAAMSSPKWAFLPGQTLFMLNPLDVYAVQHLVEFDGKMLYPLNEE